MSGELEFIPKPAPWRTAKVYVLLAGILIGVWFIAWVWPTGYKYEHHNGRLVRIDRMSGEPELLAGKGWVRLRSSDMDTYLYDRIDSTVDSTRGSGR